MVWVGENMFEFLKLDHVIEIILSNIFWMSFQNK